MKSERFTLWEEGEYSYPLACGFVPNIVSYLHEDDEIHPAMIVVPGGGYMFVSPSEGEIIAEKFFGYGYNAFVVTYTVNILGTCPLKDQASKDLSRAIRFVRAHAEQFSIDPAKVAICGFSAGGHLSASLAVHHMDLPDANPAYQNISNRPDAAILSYPVITSGEKAHRGSFDALLGKDGTEEELHYASLETQVTDETSPCFLWHTATDELVPVENSFLFEAALREHGIPHALHVFSNGHHGLSLANEKWASHDYDGSYTMEQMQNVMAAVKEGKIEVPEEFKQMMEYFEHAEMPPETPMPEVQTWPELARDWLAVVM